MHISEVRELDNNELWRELVQQERALMNLRFQKNDATVDQLERAPGHSAHDRAHTNRYQRTSDRSGTRFGRGIVITGDDWLKSPGFEDIE
jgi:hypothetical protein